MMREQNLEETVEKNNRNEMITFGVMLALGLLFYFLPGTWISIEDDSTSYLALERREGVMPGYIAFLAFFKALLSEEYFLHGVVIAQSLLALICTFLFVVVLKKAV